MSVTVTSISINLISLFITVAVKNIPPIIEGVFNTANKIIDENTQNKENVNDVEEMQIKTICRKYQTVFTNKELLIKTLDEYGFSDINNLENTVTATLDAFWVTFKRTNEQEAFEMTITVSDDCSDLGLFNDLNTEYAYNSQQETYFKIKERVKSKNLEILEEEILDDETIVLTINIG